MAFLLLSSAFDQAEGDISIDAAITLVLATGDISTVVHERTSFEQLVFVDDYTNNFLNVNEFGTTVVYYHSSLRRYETYQAIFDNPDVNLSTGDNARADDRLPSILLCEALLKHQVISGDHFIVRGKKYFVDNSDPNGAGSITVYGRLK